MPIYEFICQKCDHKFEVLLNFSENEEEVTCPECDEPKPERVFSTFSSKSSFSSSSSHAHQCNTSGSG